jgi:ATP-dependent Clp protease ATP-binding subunit ClpB
VSQFGADKFTTRSREAIEAAQLSATTAGNTTTEPLHLLAALLRQEGGTARTMITRAGADVDAPTTRAEQARDALPRARSRRRPRP